MSSCWVQTLSGRAVSLLTPGPESICLEDIAVPLSRIPRFCGHTRPVYSVAQHSLHVMQIVKDASPTDLVAHWWALLHDAAEAYTNDITTPMQETINFEIPSGWPAPVKTIQARLDRAICDAFGVPWHEVQAVKHLVKRADMIAMSTEKAQMLVPMEWNIELPPPCEVELIPVGAAQAEWLFKLAFERTLAAYRASKALATIAAE